MKTSRRYFLKATAAGMGSAALIELGESGHPRKNRYNLEQDMCGWKGFGVRPGFSKAGADSNALILCS